MRARRARVRLDREQRREESHLGHFEGRRVRVERVEPRVARLGRERLVRERRGHGRLGVGRERRQPASPRGLHVGRGGSSPPMRAPLFTTDRVVLIARHQNSEP